MGNSLSLFRQAAASRTAAKTPTPPQKPQQKQHTQQPRTQKHQQQSPSLSERNQAIKNENVTPPQQQKQPSSPLLLDTVEQQEGANLLEKVHQHAKKNQKPITAFDINRLVASINRKKNTANWKPEWKEQILELKKEVCAVTLIHQLELNNFFILYTFLGP